MSEKPTNYYPTPETPQDLINRIIFDNLYALREKSIAAGVSPAASSSKTTVIQGTGGGNTSSPPTPPTILSGPFESRPIIADNGTQYVETQRSAIASIAPYPTYLFIKGDRWVLFSGAFYRTQAQLAALSATFGANDNGAPVYVTDFHHQLEWTGASFVWGPEDEGDAGKVSMFAVAPSGTGWKAVDGTGDDGSPIGVAHPVAYLKSDGTTGTVTSMDSMVGRYPKGAAAFTGVGNAAVAPTLNNPVNTGSGNATIVNTLAVQTGVANIASTLTVQNGTANIGNDTDVGGQAVAAAGTQFALKPHAHVDTGHGHGLAGGIADLGHGHGLTGSVSDSGHTHPQSAVTANANGEPANEQYMFYLRK